MPTYDYECQKCGHRFELFQSMSEEPARKCPECKGRVKRVIGPGAGIIFRGTGFHTTDYRSDSYRKGQEKESKPAAGGEKPGGSGGKGDSPGGRGESSGGKGGADGGKKSGGD